MDLRHLRTFLAVARERHFGRAAEGLHIAQPAVSQQIRGLEADLGVRLFDRTSRSVELTAAGRTLFEGAPEILERLTRLAETTRATGRALRGELRVNYARTAPVGIATEIVQEFRRHYPDVTLSIDTVTTTRSLEQLRGGALDAAFLRLPVSETDHVTILKVGEDPLVVAFPSRHRLARRSAVAAADLTNEPIVSWPRAQGPGFYDLIITQVFGGKTPNIVRIEPDTEQMVGAVARGEGCAVTTAARASLLSVRGAVFRPFVAPVPTAPLGLGWRPSDASEPLGRFVAIARKLAVPAGRVG